MDTTNILIILIAVIILYIFIRIIIYYFIATAQNENFIMGDPNYYNYLANISSSTTKPIATKPIATKPIATKPSTTKPIATKPITTKPSTTKYVKPAEIGQLRIINLSDSSFKVKFTYPKAIGDDKTKTPSNYVIVLNQINSLGEKTSEIKMLLSDESAESNESNKSNKSNKSICEIALGGGEYTCSHIFTDVDKLDANGKNYLYRVGVAPIINGVVGDFVEPYNIPVIGGGQKMFTMEKDFKLVTNDYAGSSITSMAGSVSGTSNSDFLGEGIDSQYKLLSKEIGGYPYNINLTTSSAKQNLLADLVDKSMADSIINVKLT